MELSNEQIQNLLEWYRANKRDLPWRNRCTPYEIWISEIMLQQTRVEAVKERFALFLRELPTIDALAKCEDDRLLKLWEGMGYYSRARNLKKCAVEVMEHHDGILPEDPQKLRKLPGIGPYTSGAIASIAYGVPTPAVDGNVLRILMRYFDDFSDINKEQTKRMYEEVIRNYYASVNLNQEEVSDLTQAFMELGAIVCVPNGDPLCESCPWRADCLARKRGHLEEIPNRKTKIARPVVLKTVLILRYENQILLTRRPDSGLLAGMYEYPCLSGKLTEEAVRSAVEKTYGRIRGIKKLPDARHIFSHLEWQMCGYEIQLETRKEAEGIIAVEEKNAKDYAIPSAYQTYTKHYRDS